jgi:hypothetical protein
MKKQLSIKEIKKKHKLSNKDLACFFDLSYDSFTNSSAKQRYLTALERFYNSITPNLQ